MDANNEIRTKTQVSFNNRPSIFPNSFFDRGSSNYAFNLILREKNDDLMNNLMKKLDENGIEFRRGGAGGGNQLRQPYLRDFVGSNAWSAYPHVEHVHYYGMYVGNFPDLKISKLTQSLEYKWCS